MTQHRATGYLKASRAELYVACYVWRAKCAWLSLVLGCTQLTIWITELEPQTAYLNLRGSMPATSTKDKVVHEAGIKLHTDIK